MASTSSVFTAMISGCVNCTSITCDPGLSVKGSGSTIPPVSVTLASGFTELLDAKVNADKSKDVRITVSLNVMIRVSRFRFNSKSVINGGTVSSI